MRFLFLISLSVMTACTTVSIHRFDTEQGDKLACRGVHVSPCGLNLVGCGDDESLEFDCMKNVKYLFPLEDKK